MDLAPVLISQYLASLDMLRQTIETCPELVWNATGDKNPFWLTAYHALFFTDLYLNDSEESFTPWSGHRAGYEEWDLSQGSEPLDKADVLEYLAFCEQQVRERVPQLNLAEVADFHRRNRTTLELQIYSIRHIMQHAGELMERLAQRTGAGIEWVGSKHLS